MSDERSLEYQLGQLRNQIAHMDEREKATLENELVRLTRELVAKSATDMQRISERLKGYQEALQVRPTTAERPHSGKRGVVRRYIDVAGKLAASASRLPRSAPTAPPTGACFLLDLLLSKADRKAIPGDLEEEFRARLAKYGPVGARLWFWCETLRTIAARNPLCRWLLAGGLVRIGEWIFRNTGS
jgi:hypothetical protein